MEIRRRRSRMRRSRTGKRIEFTARDVEIFKLLNRYRYLRSTYIHAFVGGASETRFKERLGDLFHEGYLERPAQQWEFANARYQPAAYEAGAGATRILREVGDTGADRRAFFERSVHRQFRHSLMICEVLASVELAVRSNPALRFVGWPEVLAKAPASARKSAALLRLPVPSGGHLVPDGLFGIEYRAGDSKAYRFFALEADRGTMPIARTSSCQTSYMGKLALYREVIQHQTFRTSLGIPNLMVLTVTQSPARLASIVGAMVQSEPAFLFKYASASDLISPMHSLLQAPWKRAGLPPLAIDVP